MRYLVALTILATPAVAFGQDSEFLEPGMAAALQSEANSQDYLALRANGQVPLAGQAFDDIDGSDVKYGDMFTFGAAASVEWGVLYRSRRNYWAGGYLNFGGALLIGDEVSGVLGKLDVDDWTMMSAMLGLRIIKFSPGGSHFEIYAGGGWIGYGALDGESGGNSVDVFDRSGSGVGEGGVRVGWGSESFRITLGGSVRVSRGPRIADSFIDSGNGETLLLGQFDFGLEFGF